MTASEERLAELTWLTVTIPLPRPLQVGSLVIQTRQYLCVRVVFDDGVSGESFVLTRGLDVGATLGAVVVPPLVSGSAVADGAEAALRVRLRNAGWDGPISRAASAVFLAVLDGKARRDRVPVWAFLAGERPEPPPPRTVAAIGYTPVGADPAEAELAEAEQAVRAGVDVVKVMGGFDSPEVDLDRLRRVRSTVGDSCDIALDVNGSWSAEETTTLYPRLADLGVLFVEDPWPVELGLGSEWPEPSATTGLAFGEVFASTVELDAVAATRRVRYVRPDATLLGGPARFLDLLPGLAASGCELMPHFWPEVHRHLVRAYPGPSWLEGVLPGAGGFGLERFVDGLAYAGAELARTPSATVPGFGYRLDWTTLRELAEEGSERCVRLS